MLLQYYSSSFFLFLFLKALFIYLKLYCYGRSTNLCFPGVPLTITLHSSISKPLAAFPCNHHRNNGQQRKRNESYHINPGKQMVLPIRSCVIFKFKQSCRVTKLQRFLRTSGEYGLCTLLTDLLGLRT